jgi:translation initiation factor IF-2
MAIRIYEFSKKSGISSKDVLDLLQKNGFDVTNHMTVLSDEMMAFLNTHAISKETPIKKNNYQKSPRVSFSARKNDGKKEEIVPVKKDLFRIPMTVAQFSDTADIPVSDVIVQKLCFVRKIS